MLGCLVLRSTAAKDETVYLENKISETIQTGSFPKILTVTINIC